MIARGICLLLTMAAAFAQEGMDMLTADPFQCFTRLEGGTRITSAVVDVDGPGFARAWRIETRELAPNAWDLRLRCFGTRPAAKGDLGVATFWIRSTREQDAVVQFVVEQGAPPWTKPAQSTAAANAGWRKIQVPFRWDAAYDGSPSGPSSYNLSFWVNFQLQQIEIGGFSLRNYGPDVDPASLNLAGFPYPGAEPDAPWRAAASARIEQHRKADIAVTVKDAAGNPVAGAPVRVRMLRHAFGFATAIDCATLNGSSADNARYRQELLRNFNEVTIENDLKWPFFETWAAGRFDPAELWLREHGIPIHGHVLVWPGAQNLPQDVQAMLRADPVDKEALRRRINGHIERMMLFTKGRVAEWDVLNEPFDNNDVQAVLGDAEMAEWFKIAHRADPDTRLFLNDYDIVERGGFSLRHIDFTFNALKLILAHEGPVDGFGFQSHFSGGLTDPERAYAIFDKFANEVSTIQVTEFDVSGVEDSVRAQYTRDYLTLAFSHPKMSRFSLWGFWAGRHWRPEAAMFRRDWQPTPALEAWRGLIYREWWTDVEGVTGEDGVFRTRGFLGRYEVTAAGTKREIEVRRDEPNRVEAHSP
jgi:GH35 family endo-1,4-beta-xylanase